MIPAKARDLIPELAKQIGIPEEDLANMLSFYFKENKRIASKLEKAHIILRGLGILNIQGWKLEDKIKEAEDSEDIPLFEAALERWKQERVKKKQVGIKKKQFYDNKNTNNELDRETPTGMAE